MTGTKLLVALVIATGSLAPGGVGRSKIMARTVLRPASSILRLRGTGQASGCGENDEEGHAARTHRVKPGETLWTIARKECGSAGDWSAIYRLNRSTIGPDPADLRPGTVLVLSAHTPVFATRPALLAASRAPAVHGTRGPERPRERMTPSPDPRDPFMFIGAQVSSGPRPVRSPGRDPFSFER